MDAGPANQFFVLDPGFHRGEDGAWKRSKRAIATGKDRRGRVATFGGPRAGHMRYSPPERPALLRCPRCAKVSQYDGRGESTEATEKPPTAAPDAPRHSVVNLSARELWDDPDGAERKFKEMLETLASASIPPQDVDDDEGLLHSD